MKIKNILKLSKIENEVKKINGTEIIINSIDDYLDGPLSGECTWENKKYYFNCFDQIDHATDSDVRPRKYLLLELNDGQIQENIRLGKLFGRSADSEESRKEYLHALNETEACQIKNSQVIGWFDAQNICWEI